MNRRTVRGCVAPVSTADHLPRANAIRLFKSTFRSHSSGSFGDFASSTDNVKTILSESSALTSLFLVLGL